jgi:hypothetical protein
MVALHDPPFIPVALELVGDERTRALAKQLLVAIGGSALAAIVTALGEPGREPSLRWRLTQLIPSFEPAAAVDALSSLLTREDDGAVRYQIIRGLETIVRRHREVLIDRRILDDAIGATVRRAFRYLTRRVALERGATELPIRKTKGHDLLARVLDDKAKNAGDRLFRLLGLAYPLEDFVQIHRGIASGQRDAREGAMELVANVLDEPLRSAVIGLVDDLTDEERLETAGPYRPKTPEGYGPLLAELLESTSESVRSVAVFHVGELGLTQFIPRLQAMMRDEAAPASSLPDAKRVLESLTGLPQLQEVQA